MISNTDSISCVYSTAHIRVKVYLGRRLRQQWPKWISIASSRLCVTSGRLLRNTLLRMMWFFRSPAGYSRKPTKPYRGGNVDSRKVICEVAQRDCRSSFGKALGIGIVKPPSDQRTRPSSWMVGKPYLTGLWKVCPSPGSNRDRVPQADLNEAALRRTHSRVAEPTVEVI